MTLKKDRVYCDSNTYSHTGRISMHEPNLQNVPKDYVVEDEILSIRSAFVPKSGWFYLYLLKYFTIFLYFCYFTFLLN